MALNNNSKDPIYLTVNNGKFVQKVEPNTKGAVKRVNSRDKVVYELTFDSLTATIINIKTDTDNEFGKQWRVVLTDNGQIYVINLLCNSNYGFTFACALPNVDLKSKLTIRPYYELVDNKPKMAIWLYQDRHAIKWKYTNLNTNGLPPLIQKKGKGKDKGKIIYDNTDRLQFLQEMIENEILPQLGHESVIDK